MVEALSVAVRLEKYPKSSIDIFAVVLQSDGGTSQLLFSLFLHVCHSLLHFR